MRLSHAPLRIATGAFLLQGSLGKGSLVAETTAAAPGNGPAPAAKKALAASEVALGAALFVPLVPPVVAGTALAAFSSALLKIWWDAPGTHAPGAWRPSELNGAVTKDALLLGTGLALVLDGLSDSARKSARRTRKATRRKAKAVRAALPVG